MAGKKAAEGNVFSISRIVSVFLNILLLVHMLNKESKHASPRLVT